jgi:DNA-binding PucR family transcriptional regulator
VAQTTELVGQVAEQLIARADALTDEMDAAIFETSPALAADATIAAETRASSRANLMRWLTVMANHPGQPVSGDVPPEALDLARSLVRRGIELDVLLQAYRRGQNVAWRRWMETAAATVTHGPGLIDLLDVSSELMFAYVDQVLGRVLAQVQTEREELLGGALARRTATVRLILDGAPVDDNRASTQLGYDLGRRHTAVVLWADPPGQVQGALERAATALARAVGAGRPLMLPAGTSAMWAWLGTDADPDEAALRSAMAEADPHVRAVTGPTRSGMTGFRRSHAAALVAQGLVAGGGTDRLTTHREVEVVVLAGRDLEQVVEFVRGALGALADDDPAAARLRETVRVHLEEGEHAPRAAARLNTHRNTVLHRVARAEELLGHPIAGRRLAIALALELVNRLGAQALGSPRPAGQVWPAAGSPGRTTPAS